MDVYSVTSEMERHMSRVERWGSRDYEEPRMDEELDKVEEIVEKVKMGRKPRRTYDDPDDIETGDDIREMPDEFIKLEMEMLDEMERGGRKPEVKVKVSKARKVKKVAIINNSKGRGGGRNHGGNSWITF
jgi:hypothetical protein